MGELSINQVNPPAPPAPPVTEQGEPSGTSALLESIRKGKSLKHTETKIKDSSLKGKTTDENQPVASSSKNQIDNTPSNIENTPKTLTQSLSAQFDKFRKAVRGSDDGEETNDEFPSRLEEIKTQVYSQWDDTAHLTTHGPFVGQVGLNPELVVKLKNYSDVNDNEIINEISEIKPDIFMNAIEKLDIEKKEKFITINIDNNIMKLINENPGINKQQLVETLISENPQHKDKIFQVISSSLNKQLLEIESKFNAEQVEKLHKVLRDEDLKELQALNAKPSVDGIKAAISVNRTHSGLLAEVKSKTGKFEDTMNLFD